MSCPDWRALVAARDAADASPSAPATEPPGWAEARRHAAQCGRCRQAALAADPLLLFARLPERRVTADEIADMQSSVAALVRAGRVGRRPEEGRSVARRAAGSGLFSFTRVAAALGICSLLALSGAPRSRPAGLAAAGLPLGQEALAREVLPLDTVLEELDRPGARIYELPQSDMAVVMIVDASLDV